MDSTGAGDQGGQASSSTDIVPQSKGIYPGGDPSGSPSPQGSPPKPQDKGGSGEGGQGDASTTGKTGDQAGDHGEAKRPKRRTRRQKEAINRIMKCEENDYYGILDVASSASREEIRQIWRKLSVLTHTDKTDFKYAKEAFQRVSNAYQVLGSLPSKKLYDKDRTTYNAPIFADAEELFDDESADFADNAYDIHSDDSTDEDMSDEDEGDREPDKFTLATYKQATPLVNQFLRGVVVETALHDLQKLNEQLRTHNKKDKVQDLRFYINTNVLQSMATAVENAFETLNKEPTNEKGVKTLADLDEQLKKLQRTFRYPEDWKIEYPAGIEEKVAQELRKREGGKKQQEQQARNNTGSSGAAADPLGTGEPSSPGGKGKGRADPPPQSTSNNDAQGRADQSTSSAGGQTGKDQSTSSAGGQTGNPSGHPVAGNVPPTVSPATSAEVQRVQKQALQIWADEKYDTYTTSDGDIILCCKPLSKEGKDPYAYEFVVMTQESPYFQVKMGAEIGRRNRDAYFALPNKYMILTDPGDDNTPKYTWRQKEKYAGLLFVASKPRKYSTAGKAPRAPDTQCCVLWKDAQKGQGAKFAVMARGHFKKLADDDEKKLIERYCRSMGVLPPWEMDPKSVQLPADTPLGQQLLSAGRSGSLLSAQSLVNSNAPAPALNGGNAVTQDVMTNLQNAIASLQIHVHNMDSKVESTITSTNERILKQQELQTQRQEKMESKFESMMTSMNERILKQQELQTQMQERMDRDRAEQHNINTQLLQVLSDLRLGAQANST